MQMQIEIQLPQQQTVVETNLADGNRLVVCVALSLLALAVPQFMLLKLSHGQLYSEPQIIARNGKEDGHDDDKSQHTAH